MATTTIPRTAIKGGSFLIESCRPEEIFSPADLSDDQKLIGQTAEEFVTKEVLPLANELEQHKEGLMPELVRKAAELGRSEEHTSELQSRLHLVCRLLLEKKKK